MRRRFESVKNARSYEVRTGSGVRQEQEAGAGSRYAGDTRFPHLSFAQTLLLLACRDVNLLTAPASCSLSYPVATAPGSDFVFNLIM